jgi:hypothetical protein
VARRLVATTQRTDLAAQTGESLLAGREVGTSLAEFGLDDALLAVEGAQFDFEALHQAAEVDAEAVDHRRLGDLDDHQQQDDGTESARDHVEERQVEDLHPAPHGQSLAGVRNEPPVPAASCQ